MIVGAEAAGVRRPTLQHKSKHQYQTTLVGAVTFFINTKPQLKKAKNYLAGKINKAN